MIRLPRVGRGRWSAAIALLLVACFAQEVKVVGPGGGPDPGGGGPGGGAPGLTLTLNPSSGTLAIGATLRLVPTLVDNNGAPQPLGTVSWVSSNTTIATVDGNGLVTARVSGVAVITASAQGAAATASILVVNVGVASVAITPTSAGMQLGSTAQFAAVTRDASGNTLPGRPISWSTSNAAVVTVSASGLATAVGVGTATISASSEGQMASAAVTVTNVPVAFVTIAPSTLTVQIGGQGQLVATPRDAGGSPLGRPVTWSSSATGVARVSGNGLIDGISAGTATITATSGGVSGTATVTVIPPPVASLIVVPQSVTVLVGGTTTFAVTPRDANGNPLTGRVITWSSANTAIAQVSQSGVVSGIAPGSVLISAVCEGVTGSAFVTITNAPATLLRVTIAPQTAALLSGQSQTFSLTGRLTDSSDVPVSGTFTATAGSVNGNGTYVAPDQSGTFLVIGTATGTSLRDTASVTVTRPPVASIQVSPTSATIDVPQTRTFTATPRDAAGNALTNRVISWSSNNTTVATVSSSGVVTARVPGTATITATSEGQSASATATIRQTPVATVQLSPTSVTLDVGATAQLTAVTRDSNGTVLTGRPIAWSTSNSGFVSVSSSGLVTANAIGTATITATSEGRSASSTVTAAFAPVATVTLVPTSASVGIGGLRAFTATLRDSTGRVLTGRLITWTSSNNAVATVDPTGVASGIAVGTATITATSEGRSATATLDVSTQTAWPNEPAGYTRIAEHFFNTVRNTDGSGSGDSWVDEIPGGTTIVNDPTAPRSGPNVAEIAYPSGYRAGGAPGWLTLTDLNNTRELYVSFWMKTSSNWQGEGSATNKVLFVWTNNNPAVFLSNEGTGSGTLTPTMRYQGGVDSREYFTQNVGSSMPMVRGQWRRWEFVIIQNTSGASNGVIRFWIDGQKVGEYTNVRFNSGAGVWEYFSLFPVWGGTSGTVSSTQYYRFDHLYISGR